MKYSGRIIIISVVVVTIICIRTYGYIYYNVPLLQFPLVGICILFASWVMGTQYDKLKFFSEKDNLTALYNRGFILDIFPKLMASADRKQGKLVVYFIDVDDFKMINDTRGHIVGDQVLQRIAKACVRYSHTKDIVARWAGDEFLILSCVSDDRQKAFMVESIHNELEKASQEFDLPISVSIGAAVYPDEAHTLDKLLHVADLDMYVLKSDRKNSHGVVVEKS